MPEALTWVLDQDADVVVLQEVTARTQTRIRQTLARKYPHVHQCGCNDLLIASKTPFENAAGQAKSATEPSAAWVDLKDGPGRPYRLVAVRPYYPHRPFEQHEHYRWLAANLREVKAPLVVAGDFNASPWSWKLQDLQRKTGLVRHGTWALSWPANWPAQVVLIDNVLTSPDISPVAFQAGPFLGSDHRPIVATVGLP